MVTADDVTAHKPAPDLYMYAIQKLMLEPENCLVVEVSAAGIKAGVAADCKGISITKYRADKHKLPETILTIDSWQEISVSDLLALA